MRNIWAIAILRYKLVLQNRGAFMSSIFFEIFFIFFPASIWLVVLKETKDPVYNSNSMLSYYCGFFFSQAFIVWNHALDFGTKVESGTLRYQLVQPISVMEMQIGSWLGSLINKIILTMPPFLILYYLLNKFYLVHLNFDFMSLSLLFISAMIFLMLGLALSLMAFVFEDIHFLTHLMRVGLLFLGGGLVPLELLFDNKAFLHLNLFSFSGYFSAQAFIGRLSTETWQQVIIYGSMWIFIFIFIFHYLIKKLLKKYESTGG